MIARYPILRRLLSIQGGLLLLAGVLAVATFNQWQGAASLQEELVVTRAELTTAQNNLARDTSQDDIVALGNEIAQLRSTLTAVSLPTHREALRVTAVLTDAAVARGLQVLAIQTDAGSVAVGEQEFPSVDLSTDIQGLLPALVDLMGVVDGLPIHRLLDAEFTRVQVEPTPLLDGEATSVEGQPDLLLDTGVEDQPDLWIASIALQVPYDSDAGGAQ